MTVDGPDAAAQPVGDGSPEGPGTADGELAAGPDDRPRSPRGRERRRRRVRRRRVVLGLVAAVVLVVAAFVVWYEIEAHPSGPEGKEVVVEVKQGEASTTVVNRLATDGVVSSALALRVSFFFHGTPNIRPGNYLFHQNQSFSTVHGILAGGPNVFAVDVDPGFTLAEVAEAMDDVPGHVGSAFLSVAKSGVVTSPFDPPGSTNLEGLLGTGLYQILPGETDRQVLEAMVARFDTTAAAAGLTAATAAQQGMTPYQVVTVASVVQKEGYIVKNMGPVARVIDNRLSAGTPLQMNSTVLYSIGQDGGAVTAADLKLNTPYNTYLHTGLPPTPICFPSLDALKAAVNPPPGSWLFFVVVDKDGTEAFSDTYAEQLANEQLAASRGVG